MSNLDNIIKKVAPTAAGTPPVTPTVAPTAIPTTPIQTATPIVGTIPQPIVGTIPQPIVGTIPQPTTPVAQPGAAAKPLDGGLSALQGLDFKNIKETEFETLPPGTYPTSVDSVEVATINSKTAIKSQFTVLDGTEAGKKIFKTFFLQKGGKDGTPIETNGWALSQLKGFAIALNIITKESDIKSPEVLLQIVKEAPGKQIGITLSYKTNATDPSKPWANHSFAPLV